MLGGNGVIRVPDQLPRSQNDEDRTRRSTRPFDALWLGSAVPAGNGETPALAVAPAAVAELRAKVRKLDTEFRVRTRFVQKCTVRNGPLTLADRSSCRSSNRSSPHEVLGAVSGLHHPLVAVRGPSRREQPDDGERRQTDSNRPRGTGTRCCNGQTNVFVTHCSGIDRQRQEHRSLQARRLRTSPHTGLTLAPLPCISARIWFVP